MLVVEDKQTDTLEAKHVAEDHKNEPRPVYAESSQDPSCSSQILRRPSNHLSISRTHTDIKESYTIDPTLDIPAFLLPPLGKDETDETRNNLRLETTHGTISANVKLVGGEAQSEKKGKRVTMVMKSEHGGVTAKIVRTPTRPLLFYIHLRSTNGDICLHIPRSYFGPITVSHKRRSLVSSESLSRCLTIFSEANGLSRGFIGDFTAASGREIPWDGDEIFVEGKHGRVRAEFDDDDENHMNDPPPAYETLHQNPSISCPQMSRQPANYISISRTHTSIKETYIIDPTIDVPAFLIPPLKEDETEETRMNLSLEATHGSINATVRLVEGEGGIERKRKRVTIAMKSEHGGITAQILDTPTRPPFHIQLQSSNGDIRLHIPRTFHGPITISIKHGSLRFSESLEESLISFGEMDGVCTGFIGDFSALSGKEAQSWDGDEIYVEAKHGHVRVLFDDDDNEGERDGTGKLSFFWKRLFRQ